jgi:hypothetical protein
MENNYSSSQTLKISEKLFLWLFLTRLGVKKSQKMTASRLGAG